MTKFSAGSVSRRVTAADRREQLVVAATRVLVREGVRGLTTRAVTAEAGASLASLHYAFRSVDDLLAAVLVHSMGIFRARLSRNRPAGLLLAAAVAACLDALWDLVEADRDLQIVQYELTLHALRSGDPATAAAQYRDYVDCVEEYLSAATDPTQLPDADRLRVVARRITAVVDGLILQHLVEPDRSRSRADLAVLAAGALS